MTFSIVNDPIGIVFTPFGRIYTAVAEFASLLNPAGINSWVELINYY